MNRVVQAARAFVCGDEGATMVEYGMMVALIAAVCVGIVATLGTQINTAFTNVSTAIAGA
ncbi:MAG TPA: Flp family type IVb pilin [Gemmatimonadaceae bacterium]|nr:Flp family type IVb pilin [Gemmatimonadaceae bacterium]